MNIAELYSSKEILLRYSQIVISDTQRKAVKDWLQLLHDNKLEKERENYRNFSDIILRDLLNYPEEELRKGFEKENVEFSFKDKDENTKVLFEAKGTKTKELDQRQDYGKKEQETPVIQTLNYMARIPSKFGVTTNYRKYWLLDSAVGDKKCHKFDFYDMENNDEKIREFIGIFSYKKLVLENDKEELYNATIIEEKEFTDEFYKLFHETRLMLIKEFQENSKVTLTDAIYYTQLLLNRLIFIFFVEDRGFISDNRLFSNRILKLLDSDQSTEHSKKVYAEITELFIAFDKGDKGLGVFGFNGGLFSGVFPDKISFSDRKDPNFFSDERRHSKLLKSTKLNEKDSKIINKQKQLNPIISNLLLMDSFDFAPQTTSHKSEATREVSINILGHIFEQSISDLEELKQGVVSRRKKEGVYYTPQYITDYICRNTIIPYLSKSGKTSVYDLIDEYSDNMEDLENKFKEIKILDPACGSGAFLVKAIEVLLEIHKEIQIVKESTGKYSTGGQFQLTKWNEEDEIRRIIEQNIYGVDINRESIEITQLSLFLKLASNHRKLSGLSKNIKVGNSLIDDKDVDTKAFDWNKEFPEILSPLIDDRGFDVVIGNPPYVRNTMLPLGMKEHFKKFESAKKQYDLYVLFIEQGIKKLKSFGRLGFIVPNKLLSADYSTDLRKLILRDCNILKILDISNIPVFKDASTYPIITILQKNSKNESNKVEIMLCKSEDDLLKKTDHVIPQKEFLENDDYQFLIHAGKNSGIIEKIDSQSNLLGDFYEVRKGIETGNDKERTYVSDTKPKQDNHKPVLGANTIGRYKIDWNNRYVIYDKNSLNGARKPEYFEREKIVTGRTVKRLSFALDAENYYTLDTTQILFPKNNTHQLNILGLINSKLINFYYSIKFKDSHMRGGYVRCYTNFLEKIPIHKEIDKLDKNFTDDIQYILESNKEFLQTKKKFWNRVNMIFNPNKTTKKLEYFYQMSFEEFLKELKKVSEINLSLKDQDEWEDYFNDYKKELVQLDEKLKILDNKIDQTVYKIYGLTDGDIEIVEKELNN